MKTSRKLRAVEDVEIEKVKPKPIDPANPPRHMTLLGGTPYHAGKANVLETFRKYGFVPPTEIKL